MTKHTKGLFPVLCNNGGGAIHPRYFGCPICRNKVGGFLLTGNGENDWGTHKDKFCNECGQKIDWSGVEWSTIYYL
jgi:hypothetical protein